MQIAILHPGEMGAAVGRSVRALGHDVGWVSVGRSPDSRRRAEAAGLAEREDVEGCELVVSICPPAAAVQVARSLGSYSGIYVDANAISPSTAEQVRKAVTEGGAAYVDGGIIGPPPSVVASTRLYLSGERAAEVVEVFAGSQVDARQLDGPPFAASTLKMTYAAWSKGSAALLLATRTAATSYGIDRALVEEWALSQPGLEKRWQRATSAALAKGWRWEGEMREIAKTFSAVGQPGGFGVAAAAVFGAYPRPETSA
jgi:3-hydroxyisobutyrate dehydrogenase-like beta-hydroxyacid dehydrogenase